MRRFALVTAVLVVVAITVAAAIAVIAGAPGAGASRAPAARLATRFLIAAAPADDYSTARLEIVGRRGRLIRLVAGRGAGVGSASLSPDRTLVAWVVPGTGIQVENTDGSDSRLLVPCPGPVCSMAFVWSPDSRKLLILDADRGLSIVSVATGAVDQIIPHVAQLRYYPVAWSRPAHKILFMRSGASIGGNELVVARPSGAAQRTIYHSLASGGRDEPVASWSPNGKWISFTTDGANRSDPRLAIVNAATGATKRVPHFKGYTALPVWAPNSSRFAIGSPQGPVELFSPAGRRLGSLEPTLADIRAWTGGGIYLVPVVVQRSGRLLVIPNGQQKARIVFALQKGQVLVKVQPF